MELITTSGFAGKIITTIGINAVCASITTITSAARNIYDVIGGISKSKTPGQKNVVDLLEKLDLEETVKIVDSMLKEISREKISSKTLMLCLDVLTDILKKIEAELQNIDKMLRYNGSLWVLSTFRSYDCSSNMAKIEEYKNVLDSRLKRFIDLLQIKEEFKQENSDDAEKEIRYDKDYVVVVDNNGETTTNLA